MGPTSDGVVERLVLQLTAKTDTMSLTKALDLYAGISAAITGATLAVGAWGLSQAQQQDDALKTARSMQLTVEQYTALSFAADRSGVSNEKLKTGLRGLQVQLEGAARGTGEGLVWLEKLGISAVDAEGRVRSAADVLPELAEGISQLDSKGERASAMMRTLGESGADMATLLMGGADGINGLTAEAERLGVVLSTDSALASEQLVDSWTNLKAAASGLGIIVANRLIPTLIPLVDWMTSLLTQTDGFARTTAHRAAEALGRAFEFLDTRAGKAAAGVALVGTAIFAVRTGSGLVSSVSTLLPMLGGMGAGLSAVVGPAALAGAGLLAAGLIIEDLAVTARGGDSAILSLAESLGVAFETQRTAAEGSSMLFEAWGASWTVAEGFGDAALRLGLAIGDVAGSAGAMIRTLAPGVQMLNDLMGDMPDLGRWMDTLGDVYGTMGDAWGGLGDMASGRPGAGFDPSFIGNSGLQYALGPMAGGLAGAGLLGAGGIARGEHLRQQSERLSTSPTVAYASSAISVSPSVSVSVVDWAGAADAASREVHAQVLREGDALRAIQ